MFYRRFVKRTFDFLFAILALIILFVPLFLTGCIIKLTSKGPALFIQERYGKNAKPFNLYKFRSMINRAPIKSNQEFENITSFITPFGMFIRKNSIDELPQLWNIVKGDMSFIGPRPLAKTDGVVLNLRNKNGADKVYPGITGWAQVHGRNTISDEKKAEYDQYYALKMSFVLDIKIIIMTIVSINKREGIFK